VNLPSRCISTCLPTTDQLFTRRFEMRQVHKFRRLRVESSSCSSVPTKILSGEILHALSLFDRMIQSFNHGMTGTSRAYTIQITKEPMVTCARNRVLSWIFRQKTTDTIPARIAHQWTIVAGGHCANRTFLVVSSREAQGVTEVVGGRNYEETEYGLSMLAGRESVLLTICPEMLQTR